MIQAFFTSPKQILFAAILVLSSFALSLFFLFSSYKELAICKEELYSFCAEVQKKESHQNLENKILLQIAKSDPLFLQKAFSLKNAWQNSLEFIEKDRKKMALFEEVEVVQKNPVLLPIEDIKELLCIVEGVSIPPYIPLDGRPQILIPSFSLEKTEPATDFVVWSVLI